MLSKTRLETIIESSITNLFGTYREHPLRLMREIGIQARLASLLQGSLLDFCPALVVNGRKKQYKTTDTIERVQMEIRVQAPSYSGAEKSDIVVLRNFGDEPVQMHLYANGHLDIVSKIRVEDVDAVLEVKAACSSDVSQRHFFRCDIAKLLKLAQVSQEKTLRSPHMHFVLIDKSLSVGAHRTSKKLAQEDWVTETKPAVASWSPREQDLYWAKSPRPVLQKIEPVGVPFVHVWFLEHVAGGSVGSNVRHKYVWSAPVGRHAASI